MLVRPTVLTAMTRCGARAVPEPWSAIVGLAISASVTPPVWNVLGFVTLAFTSIGVPEPSARTVWGFTPATFAIPSPR